jgi:hypothetical protein
VGLLKRKPIIFNLSFMHEALVISEAKKGKAVPVTDPEGP